MGVEVQVRAAEPRDVAVVARFNALLAQETEGKLLDPATLLAGVERALACPEACRYWVAESGGEVVGQAAVTLEWSDWRNGWLWWLQSVYVKESWRARGVFRALHATIRAAALERGDVVGLRLYVENDNGRAIRTYEALGFRAGGYQVFEDIWAGAVKPLNG